MNKDWKKIYNMFRDNETTSLSKGQKDKIWARLLLGLNDYPAERQAIQKTFWQKFIGYRLFNGYALIPLLLLIFLVSTTTVSAQALPGDWLYPVKLQVENIQLLMVPTQQAKTELQVNFAKKRLQELDELDRTETKELPVAPVSPVNSDPVLPPLNSQDGVKLEQQNKNKYFAPRRIEAEFEIEKALDNLDRTKSKLRDSGNMQAVDSLDQQISRFKVEYKEKRFPRRNSREDKKDNGLEEDKPSRNRGQNNYPDFPKPRLNF